MPSAQQSLYASWGESFQPSAESLPLSTVNVDLNPETTSNREVGYKFARADGLLSFDVAVFETEREHIKTTDPVDPRRQIGVGTQRTTILSVFGFFTVRSTLALSPDVRVDLQHVSRWASEPGDLPTGDVRWWVSLLRDAELLPGWYEDWVVFERERLLHLRLTALESLAQHALDAGDHEQALMAALEAVAIDVRPGQLRGPESPFPGDDLVAVERLGHEHGQQHAVLRDARGKRLELRLVHVTARLEWIRLDSADRDLGRQRLLPGSGSADSRRQRRDARGIRDPRPGSVHGFPGLESFAG